MVWQVQYVDSAGEVGVGVAEQALNVTVQSKKKPLCPDRESQRVADRTSVQQWVAGLVFGGQSGNFRSDLGLDEI